MSLSHFNNTMVFAMRTKTQCAWSTTIFSLLAFILLTVTVPSALTQTGPARSAGSVKESRLELSSSDSRLAGSFNWAKKQAMAFVFDGDPVGPWYEAAEPGRDAFCMRDVAHQALGAHALGLARWNLNMLRRFAENVSDSRDWCSFWELNRYNRPAPVDYRNDAEFWYNLPANFDILDCCYRMYVWSGDAAYVEDPVFLNFYDRTVNDYVERWGLDLGAVMVRPRIMNVRGMRDAGKRFQEARGIPGYDEGASEYVLGVDVLATQYDAYMAYACIQEIRGDAELAQKFRKKASDVRSLVNRDWWNEKEHCFFARLTKEHTLEGRSGTDLLYRDIVDDGPKIKSALKEVREEALGGAEAIYRYGDPDTGYAKLIELTTPGVSRLEYPEISFSVIGTIASGTMGITVEASSPVNALAEGNWTATTVRTLSGLGRHVEWAELRNLPVRANEITVRHEGMHKTMLTNQHGPSLIWQPTFDGMHEKLLVNGEPVKARSGKGPLDRNLSWVRVPVVGGATVTVEIPK